METVENEDPPPPPLDPSLAPALLFDVEAASDDARSLYLYSIPKKKRALPAAAAATGFGRFVADVHWVTPQGWVLTLDAASRGVSLRDPFSSRSAVHLPPDREGLLLDGQTTRCLLSTHRRPRTDDDPACVDVVLVVHREVPVLYYCRPGGDRWLQHEYQTELIHEDRDVSVKVMEGLTAVGGRFLGHLLVDVKVVTLDFSPEPALTVAHAADSPWPVGCSQVRSWKVESCGELFMVRSCYTALCDKRVSRVQVDRLDRSSNAWVREAGLGVNRVFFVSTAQFGVSMAAHEVGLEPNCIYFTDKGDKGLYVHDMERGTSKKLHNIDPNIPDSTSPLLLMPVA